MDHRRDHTYQLRGIVRRTTIELAAFALGGFVPAVVHVPHAGHDLTTVHQAGFQPVAGHAGAQDSVIALVGGTVIDGNDGAPLPDATLLIKGDRIVALGPRSKTPLPSGAQQIDVSGKYLTPGFIDANVHVTPYTGISLGDGGAIDMALTAARQFLEHGVTTICDTWGGLPALLGARDSLSHGNVLGARLLVSGNIIGLDGAFDDVTQGMGTNLLELSPDSIRTLINQYLDKGVDFIKIAVTAHSGAPDPKAILFSKASLEVMVQEAHKRGKLVESHTQGIDGLRLAVQAGVDVLQHPEVLTGGRMPEDLARLLAQQGTVCAMMTVANSSTVDDSIPGRNRENSQILIRNGCRIAVATDDMYLMNYFGNEPHVWGEWTLRGIEMLVTLGMTPAQALTAATKNGAIAAGAEREFGTLEVGKKADVLVLQKNPLADIHNIRALELVLHGGHLLRVPRTP